MKCAVATSVDGDPTSAADEVVAQLEEALSTPASFVVVHGRASHIQDVVAQRLRDAFPDAALMGGSSCRGAMAGGAGASSALAVFALSDPEGAYGTGAAEVGSDPVTAGRTAMEQALDGADRPGEIPTLVWIAQPPGLEEAVLEGIAEVIGDDVPVLGGSTADDDVAGGWRELAPEGARTGSVVVGALFPSTEVGYAFQSGYDPTPVTGRVTERDGRRLITVDGRPAAEWYHEATDGQVFPSPTEEANILAASTLSPLGRPRGEVDGIPTFLLVHPERVHADGSLSTFATVDEGETLTVMTGSLETLTTRAARVAKDALRLAELEPNSVAGALVVYCGGCMLTVGDGLERVQAGLEEVLGPVPFLATYTFGEAGQIEEKSCHGNLMISVVVFEKDG